MNQATYTEMERISSTFFNPGMIVDNAINCWLSLSRRFLSAMTWSWAEEGGLLPVLFFSCLWNSRVSSLHVEPWEKRLLISFCGSTTPLPEFIYSCGGSCNESWLPNERKLGEACGASTETSSLVTAVVIRVPYGIPTREQLALLLNSLLPDESKGKQDPEGRWWWWISSPSDSMIWFAVNMSREFISGW